MDEQATSNSVPNELGVPSVDNSNVVVSEPANTASAPQSVVETPEVTPTEPVVEDAPAEDAPVDDAPVAPEQEPELSIPTNEHIQNLMEKRAYEASETELDVLDEYGNLDPSKFQAFMAQNNQNVFEQAVAAVNARAQAEQAEASAWEAVHQNFAEIKDNPSLEQALRGARIQDITSGGDGDLARLAKELVAPFRANKIKAVEDVNKTIEKAESLESTKPAPTSAPAAAPSLIEQLNSAVSNGDTDQASRIRHAIRKQRIYGTDK